MKLLLRLTIGLAVVVLALAIFYTVTSPRPPAWRSACGRGSGHVVDEAVCAYRNDGHRANADPKLSDAQLIANSWRDADEDYFRDMDGGATRDPADLARTLQPWVPGITADQALRAAVVGRNNWIVWTAGNDRFWDQLASQSFGNVDLLKTISSAPGTKFGRHNRWRYLGLVNEPCFKEATAPRLDRFGLYLDVRDTSDPACGPADPFEDVTKYPGVDLGARKGRQKASLYGYATGVVGLRLFPNPDFDAKAQAKWDWYRYYNDPTYYNDKALIRPYRVGMSCAFCHVGPSPTNPPADPENPKWENLNSNPGAQYFWIDRIFGFHQNAANYVFQLYHTSRPGALDTSLVSSDFINNPRTMNAIYGLGPRLELGRRLAKESLTGAERNNHQISEYVPPSSPLATYDTDRDPNGLRPRTVWTPHVLKDGADSTGVMGSLNRVYINIGLFGDEWTTHFTPVIGGTGISPIRIATGRANSAYWLANERQTPNVALFFLATAKPDLLAKAPGGTAYLRADPARIARGKTVFAENCAACHSSKLPSEADSYFTDDSCKGPGYLKCFNDYWRYAHTDKFRAEMRELVAKPDFLTDNFLSVDQRVPVTLLETNICSPMATNALRDNIWDDFSSTSYKTLPSAGTVSLHDPYTGEVRLTKTLEADGRGYTRPASLISVWSTAPYLQNNSVGEEAFDPSPAVDARMKVFNASIHQLLWPETRDGNVSFQTASGARLPGRVDVTTQVSYIPVPKGYLPRFLADLLGLFTGTHFITDQGDLRIGPLPAGTPVNLISNVDLDVRKNWFAEIGHAAHLAWTFVRLGWTLHHIKDDTPPAQATATFREVAPALMGVSKCPDYIINRGHYFGTGYAAAYAGVQPTALSDPDKEDLIEFLKTF